MSHDHVVLVPFSSSSSLAKQEHTEQRHVWQCPGMPPRRRRGGDADSNGDHAAASASASRAARGVADGHLASTHATRGGAARHGEAPLAAPAEAPDAGGTQMKAKQKHSDQRQHQQQQQQLSASCKSASAAPPPPTVTSLLVPALLTVLVAVSYHNAHTGRFVFDDNSAVIENQDVRLPLLSPSTWVSFFSNNFWGDPMSSPWARHYSYRPVVVASFAANYAVGGTDPAGYHIVNVLSHLLVTLLVERLARRLLGYALASSKGAANASLAPTTDPAGGARQSRAPSTLSQALHALARLPAPSFGSVAAGSLFAVHPVHTEAVTGIVGRAELFQAACFVAALEVYLVAIGSSASGGATGVPAKPAAVGGRRGRGAAANAAVSRPLVVLTCVLGTVGVLCKEPAITVMAVCVVAELSIGTNVLRDWRAGKRVTVNWARVGPVVGVTVLLLTLRVLLMRGEVAEFDWQTNPASKADTPARQLTQALYNAWHVWLLFWPNTLSADYSGKSIPLLDSVVDSRMVLVLAAFGGIAALGVSSAALLSQSGKHVAGARDDAAAARDSAGDDAESTAARHNRVGSVVLILLAAGVLPFVPASGWLFPIGFVVAERVVYLPSAAFCVLVALALQALWRAKGAASAAVKVVLALAVLAAVVAGAARCVSRNEDWQTEEALFKSMYEAYPDNAKAHHNYAATLEPAPENRDTREHHFRESIRLYPGYAAAYNNLGTVLAQKGSLREALKVWEDGLAVATAAPIVSPNVRILKSNIDKVKANIAKRDKLLEETRRREEEAEEARLKRAAEKKAQEERRRRLKNRPPDYS